MQEPMRRKASESAPDLTLTIDGSLYPLRLKEINGRYVAKLRKEAGMAWRDCLGAIVGVSETVPDLDIIAALMCVSKWQRGQDAEFDEICGDLNYDTTVKIAFNSEDAPAPDVPPEDDPKD